LRDKLLALVSLQKVDLDIAALRKNAETYPRDIGELEKQLAAAKSAIDAEKSKLDDLDRQRSTLETTMSDDKEKVRKWEQRLAEQRTTREYSALAREIDIAKKGQVTMGEDLVELGKSATVQREVLKAREGELVGRTQELQERIDALKVKLADVEKQVRGLDQKRADAAKSVDSNLLRQYDNVRRKKMPALTAVNAPGTCGGCRMNIPAQRYNQLVASRGIDVCPSCNRIIFAAEALGEAMPGSQ
jgi:predicted  nucleic acid-binding Zn-ribbon protein